MCDLGVPQPRARSSGTKETISVGNFHIIAHFNTKYIRKVPVFRGNKVIIYHGCGKTNIFSGQVINLAGPLANILAGKLTLGVESVNTEGDHSHLKASISIKAL